MKESQVIKGMKQVLLCADIAEGTWNIITFFHQSIYDLLATMPKNFKMTKPKTGQHVLKLLLMHF